MHLIDMIFYWSRTDPHRPAMVQPDMVTSYRALADAVESIGERIDRLALDRREPIAISLINPSYFVATVLAALHCGYSAALVSTARLPLLLPAGLRNLIYDTQGQVLSGGRNIRFDPSWLPNTSSPPKAMPHRERTADPDLIYFTSGSTGLPKKVVQTGAALRDLLTYPYSCASGAHGKILLMPGLSSTFGFNRVCEILNLGKTACFAPDSSTALGLITVFAIEVVVASAAQALDLAKVRRRYPGYRIDSISTLFVGGGSLTPDAIADLRATLCRKVVNQYGSTEAGVVALTPFDVLDDALGAVALPWAKVQIVDETGRELPQGKEGLIRYHTPQFNDNLADSSGVLNVREGWFYPGDIGSITSEGELRIHGRSTDVINRGGVKVSGTRIEDLVHALPNVKEAAACGIAGPSGLEEIWIAIVANGPVDVEDIGLRLRENTDIGVAPDRVVLVDKIPRGELGKVQKFRLREMLLSQPRAS